MSTLLTLQVEAEFVFEPNELEQFKQTAVVPQAVVDRGMTVNQSGNHQIPANTFDSAEAQPFEFPDTISFVTVISDEEVPETEEEEEETADAE